MIGTINKSDIVPGTYVLTNPSLITVHWEIFKGLIFGNFKGYINSRKFKSES